MKMLQTVAVGCFFVMLTSVGDVRTLSWGSRVKRGPYGKLTNVDNPNTWLSLKCGNGVSLFFPPHYKLAITYDNATKTCESSRRMIPDQRDFPCVQNYAKRLKYTDKQAVQPPHAGILVNLHHFGNEAHRIVDYDGNTRYIGNYPLSTLRMKIVCVDTKNK